MRAVLLAAALGAWAPTAHAAQIILNNLGGVEPGTRAYQGFTTAANFWASEISNNVTIRLDVGFAHLGENILGQTGSTGAYVATQTVEGQIKATGTSALDAIAAQHLPTLTPGQNGLGGLDVVIPGFNDPVNKLGVSTKTQILDKDGSFNNTALFVNTANLKALGFGVPSTVTDGSVTFSSDFAFDFNPTNGIGAGQIDFLAVAVHEIGHALGFVSGVDIYDLIGSPNGAFATGNEDICGVPCEKYDAQADSFASALDLFRYSNTTPFGTALTWAPGVESYFSVDGGLTSLGGFSTGEFNGDTWQASHWKAPTQAPFCAGLLGIMNPYACRSTGGIVTALDFQAFDAMGYNFVFGDDAPTLSTAKISAQFHIAPIPEPGTWGLMIAGFALMGATLRRRQAQALRIQLGSSGARPLLRQ